MLHLWYHKLSLTFLLPLTLGKQLNVGTKMHLIICMKKLLKHAATAAIRKVY